MPHLDITAYLTQYSWTLIILLDPIYTFVADPFPLLAYNLETYMVEPLPPTVRILSPPALPFEGPSILRVFPPYESVEIEYGLVNNISNPDQYIGQYIEESIISMQTVTEHPWVCTTINNNNSYVFNMITGGFVYEYSPAEFAATDWVEDARLTGL